MMDNIQCKRVDYYFVLLCMIVYRSLGYNITCPVAVHLKLRAIAICDSVGQYNCLFDTVSELYAEKCRGPRREVEGFKTTFNSGNFDKVKCSRNRYQPEGLLFDANKNADCVFKKSICSAEGQVVYQPGEESTLTDRLCICDYTRNYAFVYNTENKCSCNPSVEDCTCYKKVCQEDEKLTREYQCVRKVQVGYEVKKTTCVDILPREDHNDNDIILNIKEQKKDATYRFRFKGIYAWVYCKIWIRKRIKYIKYRITGKAEIEIQERQTNPELEPEPDSEDNVSTASKQGKADFSIDVNKLQERQADLESDEEDNFVLAHSYLEFNDDTTSEREDNVATASKQGIQRTDIEGYCSSNRTGDNMNTHCQDASIIRDVHGTGSGELLNEFQKNETENHYQTNTKFNLREEGEKENKTPMSPKVREVRQEHSDTNSTDCENYQPTCHQNLSPGEDKKPSDINKNSSKQGVYLEHLSTKSEIDTSEITTKDHCVVSIENTDNNEDCNDGLTYKQNENENVGFEKDLDSVNGNYEQNQQDEERTLPTYMNTVFDSVKGLFKWGAKDVNAKDASYLYACDGNDLSSNDSKINLKHPTDSDPIKNITNVYVQENDFTIEKTDLSLIGNDSSNTDSEVHLTENDSSSNKSDKSVGDFNKNNSDVSFEESDQMQNGTDVIQTGKDPNDSKVTQQVKDLGSSESDFSIHEKEQDVHTPGHIKSNVILSEDLESIQTETIDDISKVSSPDKQVSSTFIGRDSADKHLANTQGHSGEFLTKTGSLTHEMRLDDNQMQGEEQIKKDEEKFANLMNF